MNSVVPQATQAVRIAAFYGFARVADPPALAARLKAFGTEHGLRGSVIVASEGVNGTIAGSAEAVSALIGTLRTLPGFDALVPRLHDAEAMPFGRWKVKVKPEIVTLGVDVDAATGAGRHVDPADWNALISDPDVVLIDTRNEYEVAIGSFEGAIDPHTASFGDFPAWFDAQARQWATEGRKPRIAMFCTGGIRCEKSTAYARARGFEEVYHLKGGILAYLAEVEASQSLWQGECFLFDARVSLTHGEGSGDARLCTHCGQPVLPDATHCCAD